MGKLFTLLLVLVLVASGSVAVLPVNAGSIVVSPDESWLTLSDALRLASEGTTIKIPK